MNKYLGSDYLEDIRETEGEDASYDEDEEYDDETAPMLHSEGVDSGSKPRMKKGKREEGASGNIGGEVSFDTLAKNKLALRRANVPVKSRFKEDECSPSVSYTRRYSDDRDTDDEGDSYSGE